MEFTKLFFKYMKAVLTSHVYWLYNPCSLLVLYSFHCKLYLILLTDCYSISLPPIYVLCWLFYAYGMYLFCCEIANNVNVKV